MKTHFAYIRVSTAKQGEKGSSLVEQRDAITRYAAKHSLSVAEWFEERETAAKRGRTVFRRMLTALKRGQADGLIMHKVDRGARNLADWAELASLMDAGIAVHFAHESIDLASRGGRLSADIQAVVAADFIRNLRDEVKKGQQGRLKQGQYPWGAPPGYQNNGKGAVKTIDPVQGPLVREAFELYASGRFGLHALRQHMNAKGLRNSHGRPFHVSGIAKLLRSPFYYGLIIVKGQSYLGIHTPLISKALFDAARARAEGRLVAPTRVWGKAEYRFRRLAQCGTCGLMLTPETQRGHVYYRCHTRSCRGTCVREEAIAEAVTLPLSYLPLSPVLTTILRIELAAQEQNQAEQEQASKRHLALQLAQIDARLNRLTDLLIDGAIDQAVYDSRRTSLHNEKLTAEAAREDLENRDERAAKVEKYFEHVMALQNLTNLENPRKFREIAETVISNIIVAGKSVEIQWQNAISMLVDLAGFLSSGHERQASRTWRRNVTATKMPLPPRPVRMSEAAFRKALHNRAAALFQAILSDQQRDEEVPDAANDREVQERLPYERLRP